MPLLIFLVILIGLLVGFLAWKKVPRKLAFEILLGIFWVFVLFAFVSMRFFEEATANNSLIPFLPPIVPCLLFIYWAMRRVRKLGQK
jgi:CHASE2 domain-containing sensor protein